MELIRISQHKLKIMLTESDMQIYEIPEGYGGGDADIREALRAVLTEAGKRTGLDFSGRKYSVQFFPSRGGGGEMFVTRFDESLTEAAEERDDEPASAAGPVRWEYAEAFSFASLEHLLAVCHALSESGFAHRSAAFFDERGRYYLFAEAPGLHRPMMNEYGKSESARAVGLYITEHGQEICTSNAVEILGKC